MDVLVMKTYILYKTYLKPLAKDIDWRKEFELDGLRIEKKYLG